MDKTRQFRHQATHALNVGTLCVYKYGAQAYRL